MTQLTSSTPTPRRRMLVLYNGETPDGQLSALLPDLEAELILIAADDFDIEILRKHQPDLILLNVNQTDLKMKEICQQLHRSGIQPPIPIFIVGGYRNKRFIEHFLKRKATDVHYIGKYNNRDFLNKAQILFDLVQTERKSREQETTIGLLVELTTILVKHADPHEIFFSFASTLARHYEALRCSIVRIDRFRGKGLVVATSESPDICDLSLELHFYPEIEQCVLQRRIQFFKNYQSNSLFAKVLQRIPKGKFRSILVIPIIHQEVVTAVIHMKFRQENTISLKSQEQLIGAVAAMLGHPVKSAAAAQGKDDSTIADKSLILEELSGAVSHRLNQPLTSILGYANFLLSRSNEDDQSYHPLKVVHDEAMRMAEIIRKISSIKEYKTEQYVGSRNILVLDPESSEVSPGIVSPDDSNILRRSIEIGGELENCFNPHEVLQVMKRYIEKECSDHGQTYWLRDAATNQLVPVSTTTDIPLKYFKILPLTIAIKGVSLFTQRIIYITDPYGDHDILGTIPNKAEESGIGVFVPLSVSRNYLGLILITFPENFTTPIREEEYLKVLSRRVSLELRNLQLFETRKYLEQYIETVLEHTPSLFLVLDLEGKICKANRVFSELLGFSSKEFIGRHLSDFLIDQSVDTFDRLYERALEGTANKGTLLNFLDKSGRTIDILTNSITTFRQKNKPIQIILMGINKTRETMFENSLFQMEKMTSLGTLTASIAHELNNPLATMKLNNEYLIRKVELGQIDSERDVKKNKAIAESIERMESLIASIMSYARPSLPNSFCKIDLNEIVLQTLIFGEHYVKHYGVKIETDLAPSLPALFAVRDQIQQVLINLISNAAQALDHKANGKIVVRTKEIDDRVIAVEVEDNGPGIDATTLPQIFEPFFSTKKIGEGTGLGLSIVERIVKNNAGQIEVVSDGENGTTFKIFFPVAFALPLEASQ